MPLHLSLIACDHRATDAVLLRGALEARAIEVWASPGVVAVAVLADEARCGLLSTWADRSAFEAWQQRLSYRRMQDFLKQHSDRAPWTFDCAFHETDIAPPEQRSARPGPPTSSVVTLRHPTE
jgi:heme-degrading monooxygenase HmoA